MLNTIIKYLWAIFLFIFPFSLSFIFYEEASYRFGHFNPWVTGFIYLPEILLGLIFVLWLFLSFPGKQINWESVKKALFTDIKHWLWFICILFIINAGVITYLNGHIVLFSIFLLRIIEAVFVCLLIKNELLPHKKIIKILLTAAVFQIILGYLQWHFNHSLNLGIIGEQILGPDIAGVAKTDLSSGLKQIRPYGTFLHPNILSAYLMTILFISFSYIKKYHLIFWMILLFGGIFLTDSLAVKIVTPALFVLAISFNFIRHKIPKKWILFTFIIILLTSNLWLFQKSHAIHINNQSWQERLDQNIISRNMFFETPLGVGINNFTLEMEKYSADKLLPWEFQPVHNTYFLILNETGIQGLILMIALIAMLFYVYPLTVSALPLIGLILIAPFDHFLWDSFSGLMLIGIAMGFLSVEPLVKD